QLSNHIKNLLKRSLSIGHTEPVTQSSHELVMIHDKLLPTNHFTRPGRTRAFNRRRNRDAKNRSRRMSAPTETETVASSRNRRLSRRLDVGRTIPLISKPSSHSLLSRVPRLSLHR